MNYQIKKEEIKLLLIYGHYIKQTIILGLWTVKQVYFSWKSAKTDHLILSLYNHVYNIISSFHYVFRFLYLTSLHLLQILSHFSAAVNCDQCPLFFFNRSWERSRWSRKLLLKNEVRVIRITVRHNFWTIRACPKSKSLLGRMDE